MYRPTGRRVLSFRLTNVFSGDAWRSEGATRYFGRQNATHAALRLGIYREVSA